MNLQELIADAKRRQEAKKTRAPRPKKKDGEDAVAQTKEYLRQLKLDACVPVSVHLRVTHQTCECGAHHESVNNYPLIKKESPSLTHYESVVSENPADLSQYNDLPRFIDVTKVYVPWCEDCFANAHYTFTEVAPTRD